DEARKRTDRKSKRHVGAEIAMAVVSSVSSAMRARPNVSVRMTKRPKPATSRSAPRSQSAYAATSNAPNTASRIVVIVMRATSSNEKKISYGHWHKGNNAVKGN